MPATLNPTAKYYKYKLNDNYKGDTWCIDGVHLSKKWSDPTLNKIPCFENHLKTKLNPDGVIDSEYFDGKTNKPIISSDSKFSERIEKFFSMEELSAMTRKELEESASLFNVPTLSQRDPILIKAILKAQNEYKKQSFETFVDSYVM